MSCADAIPPILGDQTPIHVKISTLHYGLECALKERDELRAEVERVAAQRDALLEVVTAAKLRGY